MYKQNSTCKEFFFVTSNITAFFLTWVKYTHNISFSNTLYIRHMKRLLTSAFLFFIGFSLFAQSPKIVVGIVIDQMRQDYIYRYWDRLSDDGFKRIINDGVMFENAQYNYVPTYTGPGHASIYTGTTPATHGIAANNWYKTNIDKTIYCVDDSLHPIVGQGSGQGKSPANLKTTTITDQLRLSNMFKSKVVSVSLKDRSAILPAGHMANGAYWFDTKSGEFVTSTFYMNELPKWVKEFNAQKLPANYAKQKWETLYPIETYTASYSDNNNYEELVGGKTTPTFPYEFNNTIKKDGYKFIAYSPYGNTILVNLSKAAIEGEALGSNSTTDFLCLSFSSTDYAGHYFGPQAVEVEDMYLRLDKELATLFNYLDDKMGKGNWSTFITADHGGNDVPAFLTDNKIPAGILQSDTIVAYLAGVLKAEYGENLIEKYINEQVYLNHERIKALKLSACEVQEFVGNQAAQLAGIARYYTRCSFSKGIVGALEVEQSLYNGWNMKESGDVMLLTEPGWMNYGAKGTSHGSPWAYDTRVPLLFYGAGIKKGKTATRVSITDIAPTIAILLKLQFPNGCSGKPLDVFKD